jgi:hypothetical protein
MTDAIAKRYEEEKEKDFQDFKLSESDRRYIGRIKKLADQKNFQVLYVMSPKYIDVINPNYAIKHEGIRETVLNSGSEYLDYNILSNQVGITQRSFENGYIGYQHTSHYGANQISIHLANKINEKFSNVISAKNSRGTYLWKKRMALTPEYYIFQESDLNSKNQIRLGENLILFEDVKINNLYLLKDERGCGKLIFEFPNDLNISRLERYKFYVHLYPDKADAKIIEERKKFGFENYDFSPQILPKIDGGYYTIRELNTKIKKVEKLNIGLFSTGLEKSRETSISSFEF